MQIQNNNYSRQNLSFGHRVDAQNLEKLGKAACTQVKMAARSLEMMEGDEVVTMRALDGSTDIFFNKILEVWAGGVKAFSAKVNPDASLSNGNPIKANDIVGAVVDTIEASKAQAAQGIKNKLFV